MATTNTPYPVATLIQVGEISGGLSSIDNLKQRSFKNGSIDNRLPLLIYLVTQSVKYSYEVAPLSDTTTSVANYLWALCRRYANTALAKLGQGSGGIIIDPGGGQPINLRWVTMSFTVGDAGAPVLAGQQQFTISLTNILSDSASFGISNGSPLPRTGTVTPDQRTYLPTYYQPSMVITTNFEFADGEQYTLSFGRSTSGSSFNPPSVVLPTPYLEGQYLTNDGTELRWDNPFIEITSADFPDGVTYTNAALAIHSYGVFLNELNRYLIQGTEFVPILSGGFTVIMAGFDATVNSYTLKINTAGA